MYIYFGGCERPNAIHTLNRAGGRRVMISFAEPPTETCWRLYRQYGIEIMADSGAFSAWKQGREINIQDYMTWLTKRNINLYFNLDVVGDPESTATNQAKMEAAGFSPIPVFHYGEPWELLDQLVNKNAQVGLGGTVGRGFTEKVNWLQQVFSRHPEGKFHALGITSEQILTQFPFTSVDSTWWVFKHRENVRRLAPGTDRKAEQAARVRFLLQLEQREERQYQQVMAF